MTGIPMRRLGLDRAVEKVGGRPVPDADGGHLGGLLDECADALRFVRVADTLRNRIAEAGPDGPGHYVVAYNPQFADTLPGVDVDAWKTAAMLHELMHVSCALKYPRPAAGDLSLFNNFHVPDGTGREIDDSMGSQLDVAYANYEKLMTALDTDVTKKRIAAGHGDHLRRRIEYGGSTMNVHYETVLLDIVLYMTMGKVAAGETLTLSLAWAMSVEAADRRNSAEPYPLTKRF